MSPATARKLDSARSAVRLVERFAYGMVSDATEGPEMTEAQYALRLAIGLRRKLDNLAARTSPLREHPAR